MNPWTFNQADSHIQLPKLSSRISEIETVTPILSAPISEAFKSVWFSKKSTDLQQDLETLTSGFMTLAKQSRNNVRPQIKDHENDFVTEVDQGLEMLFRIWLDKHYPEHKIIGEEGQKSLITPTDFVWYIDPIDGTANYIRGSNDVSIHICCIQNGKPVASVVGLPFQNKIITNSVETQTSNHSSKLIIGTEFMPHRIHESTQYKKILTTFSASSLQKNAIGVNILSLKNGQSNGFYKPKVKPWDIMAPLAVLDPEKWDISLRYQSDNWISPFSNNPAFIKHLNNCFKTDCRIGDIFVTPVDNPTLKQKLTELVQ